ncbi:MAG: tetratricopeptide repeat protein [Verrucomicrobiota bacterium]
MKFKHHLRSKAIVLGWIWVALGAVCQSLNGQESDQAFDPFSDEVQQQLEAIALEERDDSQKFLEPGQVRELTEIARPSLVTVRQLNRDGNRRGTGSGFLISKEGLVVTNLHVIGEGRSIEVQFVDGSVHPVIEVFASDRYYDLAVLRIDPEGLDLEPLKIADSSSLSQGDLIVGFGAPQGLSFSVVAGVISAIRKLEPGFIGEGETPDYPMLQLAMPIEQGNSGGPILNLNGEVVGVVTLRHRVTDNLGFAVASNDLKVLLKKPNPIPISRWRTIGVLDSRLWSVVMGATWTQRGGVITARETGDGFGGRSLCLSAIKVPKEPFEIEVRVRLDNVSGAAGIAFAADGEDKHYGFYPTGGKIRLTRFDGADVYSWSILKQVESSAYRPGEWNHLRVRVKDSLITGWVNGEQVLEVEDDGLTGGKAGLCKFRETIAEFKGFRVEKRLGEENFPDVDRQRLSKAISRFEEGEDHDLIAGELSLEGNYGRAMLRERAEELNAMAAKLEALENDVHRQMVIHELSKLLAQPEEDIDLFEVGLQISRIDDPEIELEHYRSAFARLVEDARDYLLVHALEGGGKVQAEALRDFLFKENGFHGSRTEYYHHSNSYVNHVLDDREGLPITLSIVFVEMARRLEIPGVFGVPLPGKFMVGVTYPAKQVDKTIYIDVYENGTTLTRARATREVWAILGSPPQKSAFQPASPREIAVRMLRNLVDIEINKRKTPQGARNYLELLLAIEPDAAQERFQRALLQIQSEDLDGARRDLDWLLEHRPPGIDYSRLEVFRDSLPD